MTGFAPGPTANNNGDPQQASGFGTDLVMALRLYSRLPTGKTAHRKPDLSRIALAAPFASLIIQIAPALLLVAGSLLGLPHFFTACLAVAAFVLATGAMAEDALADAMDGLFGAESPEKRLAIMKDSRHGTYGVCAIVLILAARITVLANLLTGGPLKAALVWTGAVILSRSLSLFLTVALGPARMTGVSATAKPPKLAYVIAGTAIALILTFICVAPFTGWLKVILAAILSATIIFGWMHLCRKLVGGHTGDLIGALQALLEIAALAAFIFTVGR